MRDPFNDHDKYNPLYLQIIHKFPHKFLKDVNVRICYYCTIVKHNDIDIFGWKSSGHYHYKLWSTTRCRKVIYPDDGEVPGESLVTCIRYSN